MADIYIQGYPADTNWTDQMIFYIQSENKLDKNCTFSTDVVTILINNVQTKNKTIFRCEGKG